MEALYYGLIFIAGLIAGSIVTSSTISHKHHVGTLREDRSDPDSPYLFLELSKEGYQKIHEYEWVTLNVILKDYLL